MPIILHILLVITCTSLDSDNDGVMNREDNCPLIPNPDQADICSEDFDGDGAPDDVDVCPKNKNIVKTEFRAVKVMPMGENAYSQKQPQWEFRNEGKEIYQKLNSAPFLAIGGAQLADVDFEATLFVGTSADNDWIGVLFSFQVFFFAFW